MLKMGLISWKVLKKKLIWKEEERNSDRQQEVEFNPIGTMESDDQLVSTKGHQKKISIDERCKI